MVATVFFVILSLIQFLVIVYLISHRDGHQNEKNTKESSVVMDQTAYNLQGSVPLQSKSKVKRSETNPNLVVVNPTSTTEKKYAGVAAVVLLHAPKWFQRRYTIMVQNIHNNIPPGKS
mgnify:CR=1 FL=1